jgi:hypothetical protein
LSFQNTWKVEAGISVPAPTRKGGEKGGTTVESKKELLKQILHRFGKKGKNLDEEFYELDLHAIQRTIERTDLDLLEIIRLDFVLLEFAPQIPSGHWVYLYRESELLGGFLIRPDKKPRTFLLEGMEVKGIMQVSGKIFMGAKIKTKKLPKPEYWKFFPTEDAEPPKKGKWKKLRR